MACFHETILAVGLSRLHAFPGDRLDMVYSRQDDFKKMMRGLWRWSQENREYGPSLGTLDFQDMRDVPGLQVADLLVYEFRHYYHLRETRPDLDLRLPFRVMLEHQKVLGVKMLKYLPYWVLDFHGAIIRPLR